MAQRHHDLTDSAARSVTTGDVLAAYLRAQATEFLRALRLHRETGGGVSNGSAHTGDSVDAARALRRSARRISGNLHTFRPLLDPDWSEEIRPELAWVSGTLALEHACEARLERLLLALHRLSGAPVLPTQKAGTGKPSRASGTGNPSRASGTGNPSRASGTGNPSRASGASAAAGAGTPAGVSTTAAGTSAGASSTTGAGASTGTPTTGAGTSAGAPTGPGAPTATAPTGSSTATGAPTTGPGPSAGAPTGPGAPTATSPTGSSTATGASSTGTGTGTGASPGTGAAASAGKGGGRTAVSATATGTGASPATGGGRTAGAAAHLAVSGTARPAAPDRGSLTVGAAKAGALLDRQLTLARTRAHSTALQALGSSRFHAVADKVAVLASEVPLTRTAATTDLRPFAAAAEERLADAVAALPLVTAGHPYNAEALVHGLSPDPAPHPQDAPWHQVRLLLRLHRYALEVLHALDADGAPLDGWLLCAGQALDRHRDASEAAAAAAHAARTPRIAPATAYALGVLHADQRHEVEAARYAFQRSWQKQPIGTGAS